MDRSQDNNHLKSEAWNKAFYAHGTTYIFEKRSHKYRIGLRLISFFGIAVPLCIGALIMSFNLRPEVLKYILFIAGVLGVFQLIASLWSIIARWEERYSSAMTAIKRNTDLRNKWERIAKKTGNILDSEFEALLKEDKEQEILDLDNGITEMEKRLGMRAGLFHYKRPCATCNQVPTSMVASGCDTCGNY